MRQLVKPFAGKRAERLAQLGPSQLRRASDAPVVLLVALDQSWRAGFCGHSLSLMKGIFPRVPNQWLPQPRQRSGKSRHNRGARQKASAGSALRPARALWIHLVRARLTINRRGGGWHGRLVRWWSMSGQVDWPSRLAPGAAFEVAHFKV